MKALKKLTLILLTAVLCSIASAKPKDAKSSATEPAYTVDSSHDMDANWEMYFSTGDEKYLENILVYVNTEDLLLKNINKKAKSLFKDKRFTDAMIKLGADRNGNKVELYYDLEMMTGFLLGDELFADDIKYIYSLFPEDLFIRGVMKNTAFWSLLSNASQNDDINIAIQKHIPYLNEKSQKTFYLSMEMKEEIPLIKSDKGATEFSDGKIYLMPVLVNDLEGTIEEWTRLKPEEQPIIKSSSNVNLKTGTDSISPFILFSANDDAELPIFYDAELIKPDGSKSQFKGTKLNLISEKPENPNFVFAAPQNFKWVFDKTDAPGKYTLRLSVYTSKQVIAVFEMDFKLKK
ncbi:MAG: hypothetical protein VZR56_08565 [Treponema sp.]|nr:hypothetical protein [Treponema sp.]